jgi:serine/threonine protein kinase
VHRDLKSLNLLLDAKWNVKVSDFGLTKFQDQLKKENQNQLLELGSIHWTAPEVHTWLSSLIGDAIVSPFLPTSPKVLSEMHGIDLEAADIYSFGIVLWEVISREDVYAGMR